ncbi:MAG: hypothetical protein QGI78_08355 [Phycisphaerales bacterium]|jgi:hypothetical protein|nr:hypothetical protein [Phycisphaerales bacterium]
MIRVFLCCCFFAISACAPRGARIVKEDTIPQADILQAQIERTKYFGALVGRGVIEFHWVDEDGAHRAQGDFDFWKSGSALSLRISKGSEPLMWIGGDAHNHWMFDMLDEESKLLINQEDVTLSEIEHTLVLLGLTPLPSGETTTHQGIVSVKANGETWQATYDPISHRPLRIELKNDKQQTTAMHRSGLKVELVGKNRLRWPASGKLIDIVSTTSDAEIKIDFAWLSTDTSQERMDRVFDVEFLQKALKPRRVEGSLR